jgi:ribosome-associated protein
MNEAQTDRTRELVEAALGRGAAEPVVLDIGPVSAFADVFVLLTGRSDRQVRAIADGVLGHMKNSGESPLGVEGLSEGRWVLIDAGDIVLHVFDEETRKLYALERLWADAERIDLGLPAAVTGAATGDVA